jgi:hypothetical protein
MKTKNVLKMILAMSVVAALINFSSCRKSESGNPDSDKGSVENRVSNLIFPPQAHMYGKTYAEWGAAFFNWEYNFDCAHYPYLDTNGALQNQNQSGDVFFLAGSRRVTLNREVTVPAGVSLFVPIVYFYEDDCSLAPGGSLVDSAALYSSYMDTHTLIIDGVSVDVSNYLFVTREFNFTANADLPGCTGDVCFDGTQHSTSLGGYWVILKPLAAGDHTIHSIGGANCAVCPPGVKDVTWTIHQQ